MNNSHQTISCSNCGNSVSEKDNFCPQCGVSLIELDADAEVEKAHHEPAGGEGSNGEGEGQGEFFEALSERYNSAYLVANAATRFGNFVKAAGGFVLISSALILVLPFASQVFGYSVGGSLLLTGGSIAGVVFGILLYLAGLIAAAQGQTLLASLDSALNNSPLLHSEEKATIMGF